MWVKECLIRVSSIEAWRPVAHTGFETRWRRRMHPYNSPILYPHCQSLSNYITEFAYRNPHFIGESQSVWYIGCEVSLCDPTVSVPCVSWLHLGEPRPEIQKD